MGALLTGLAMGTSVPGSDPTVGTRVSAVHLFIPCARLCAQRGEGTS